MLEWIAHHPAAAIFAMFVGFAVLEFLRGRFRSAQASSEAAPLEVSITLLFAALIYPGIVLVVGFLATHYTPGGLKLDFLTVLLPIVHPSILPRSGRIGKRKERGQHAPVGSHLLAIRRKGAR